MTTKWWDNRFDLFQVNFVKFLHWVLTKMIVSGKVTIACPWWEGILIPRSGNLKSIKIKPSIVLRAHHKALSRAKHLANRIEGYESNNRLYYKSLS